MPRIPAADLARGFTVLMIPPIHTVMVLSSLTVHHSWLGDILAFIAEGPGGQLFMLLMGMFVALKPAPSFTSVVQRAILLAVVGYLLNVLKFVIPYQLHLLPDGLLQELQAGGEGDTLRLLLTGDILQFAAIAYLVVHAIYRLPHYHWIALGLSVSIVAFGSWCWDLHSATRVLDYGLQLIGGQPPRVFFPLFPWLVYPLAGLVLGYCLVRSRTRWGHFHFLFGSCKHLGVALLIVWYVVRLVLPMSTDTHAGFYRTEWPETIQHLGIVLVTLYAWNWLYEQTCGKEWLRRFLQPFFQLLHYSSRHITRIYILQWPLVIWLVPFFGFQQLSLIPSIGLICVVTGITYSVCYLADQVQAWRQKV